MYYTKAQFLEVLKAELLKRGITDNEILEDFEQHFEIGLSQGLTEAQVCEKLGAPAEIANQYAPEGYTESTDTKQNTNQTESNTTSAQTQQSAFAENNYNYSNANQSAPQNNGDNADVAKMVGVICLDVLVLTWAIPTLFSLLISYWAVMISFFVTPVVMIIGIIFGSYFFSAPMIVSMLTPAAGIFAALILFGIALIMSAFCVDIWKGFGKLMQAIARLHYEAFTGKKATF
ncbi:MAG: DUF1700 domain-containing protein [Ruminiclostridium sp.]|nr:DUF1700 domain-containing protein [Ruminiclostridium sp.]